MSVTSGFFNSVNGDRRYSAEQMSAMLDGIISDGVFASVGTAFSVSATSGNVITVGVGRAWFNHTWVYNDSPLPLTAEASDVVLNRYDAVIIEVDHSDSVRKGSIKIVTGVAAKSPVYPTLINTTSVHQYPIAYIYRPANSSAITQDNITYNVGTDECKYVTGPLEVHSIDTIVAQWRAEFYKWFDELDAVLSGDVAANLTERVLSVENQISSSQIHRSNFRGKNLGSEVTTEQLAAIRRGDFKDLFLGDYWVINGTTWRIADFDYWYNCGDTAFTKHHVVIMPDVLYDLSGNLCSSPMHESTDLSDGYVGTDFRVNVLPTVKTIVDSSFPNMALTHREYLINAVDKNIGGQTKAGAWYDSSVELPNEHMIYGSVIQGTTKSCSGNGSVSYTKDVIMYTNSKTMLALFSVRPDLIVADRKRYWLRDVAGGTTYAMVAESGEASWSKVTNSRGIRPVFAIG